MQDLALGITLCLGLVTVLGGLIGHVKARSRVSLAMGVGFGTALLVVGIAGVIGWERTFHVSATLSGVLLVVFGIRYVRTKKMMPMGILAIFSLASLAANTAALLFENGTS